MSGANPDHMHHIAQNKLKDNLPCICFKRHCQLLCLAYISIDSIGIYFRAVAADMCVHGFCFVFYVEVFRCKLSFRR